MKSRPAPVSPACRTARVALVVLALVASTLTASARTGTGPGGYSWQDCEEIDGPACTYVIEASSDGFTGLCSDEIYRPPGGMGFPFPFYGTTYNTFFMSANGVIYLANRPPSDAINEPLTGLEGRPMIAPLWDDWAMDNDDDFNIFCPDPGCSNSGPITFVESYRLGGGVDPQGVAYRDIEWFDTAKHRPTCSEPETATFGLRLYADGRILFNYLDVVVGQPFETDFGISATIGVSRGSAGEHTQFSFDAASIPYEPYAILFTPPCPALNCTRIAAPDDACEGASISFRADFTGGVMPHSVSWDFDADTLPDATGNPVTRVLPIGTSTVVATITDSCGLPAPGTCSMNHVITVHPLPRPIVTPQSSTSFCGANGESVILQADAGFASYQWEREGFEIPGAVTATLDTNVSGSHVVRVVDGFGCEGVSLPIIVDAEDCTAGCTPLTCDDILISPLPGCEGDRLSLTVIFTGGEGAVTVEWDVDGDTIPDASGNPLRRVFATGMTSVTVSVTDDCTVPGAQSCTFTTTVNVNPAPEPVISASGPLVICPALGESVSLDAGPGWSSHQWLLDGGEILGETGQAHVTTLAGSYTVRVTDADGCPGESLPVQVVVDCPSACASLACGLVTITPATACEGETQQLLLEIIGGEPPVGVAWDLDGDTLPDAVGNPVDVTLTAGTHRVRGVAADGCTSPGPQSCSSFADAVVEPAASAIGEISGAGDPPLLVLSTAARIEVEDSPGATAYHAYVDAIGSWWAPSDASGRACSLVSAGPGARPGTLLLDVPLPPGSWLVIAGANSCGEGTPGASSLGVERSTGAGWQACGASP